ncbi:hypothetical protein LTR78_008887 [Recurvomyces mirabilis]|uniref:Dipeptidyl-peptidase V n=1 Tax=Recurvomyces mirabilis TaxID=574656 RepID=A0AAE0TUA9_9PEZI|nr:hypothetical protein LTR78_008887 [Recurvomyces mirabilis]KAK5155802.1 hypothetical protein LTS14_005368 [Recurvomyces mirabilis]
MSEGGSQYILIIGMKFTPEVLLSAPRRSAGVPNPSGTKVLYSQSSYDFSTHKKAVVVQLLEVATGEAQTVAEDDNLSDFNWLDDESFVCLQAGKDGTTKVCVLSVKADSLVTSVRQHEAGTIQAAASNLKITPIEGSHDVAIVVSAPTGPDGCLWTSEQPSKKTQSTGRLYSSLYVRHWDQWKGKDKNSLWYGKLSRGSGGKYALSELHNALKDTGLECPIPPFGGGDHFDVGRQGIIFVAKDPELNPALNTKCNVYILKITSWTGSNSLELEKIPVDDFHGAASSPVWNPDGSGAAFLMMHGAGYEADQNWVFVMRDIQTGTTGTRVQRLGGEDLDAQSKDSFWSRSPSAIAFSADSRSILATAEDTGHGKLFEISLENTGVRKLTDTGYVGDFKRLADGKIFISGSSIVESSWYKIVDATQTGSAVSEVWSHSHLASRNGLGLDSRQVSTIWTPASNPKINKEVHSIVVKPSTFKSGKKYPVAYLIHGGPQGSWGDSWSTR